MHLLFQPVDLSGERKQLLKSLQKREGLATGPKWKRFLFSPLRYTSTLLFAKVIYRLTHKRWRKRVSLFWDDDITICLPAAMDLAILGCKTHDSEIRLGKFLIRYLPAGAGFMDVGAHLGYYSLLAGKCTGEEGAVLAIEPATSAFDLLLHNTSRSKTIRTVQAALAETDGQAVFYEFPAVYEENNTLAPENFRNKSWIGKVITREVPVMLMKGDSLLSQTGINPAIIKLDVEGGEARVIKGLRHYLEHHDPVLVMEFAGTGRHNEPHLEADHLLRAMGYESFSIDRSGSPVPINGSTEAFVSSTGLESDNIIYKKR